jgi:hypothetical protein
VAPWCCPAVLHHRSGCPAHRVPCLTCAGSKGAWLNPHPAVLTCRHLPTQHDKPGGAHAPAAGFLKSEACWGGAI